MDNAIKTLTNKDCTVYRRQRQSSKRKWANWGNISRFFSRRSQPVLLGVLWVQWEEGLRRYTGFISSNTNFCIKDHTTPCASRECDKGGYRGIEGGMTTLWGARNILYVCNSICLIYQYFSGKAAKKILLKVLVKNKKKNGKKNPKTKGGFRH